MKLIFDGKSSFLEGNFGIGDVGDASWSARNEIVSNSLQRSERPTQDKRYKMTYFLISCLALALDPQGSFQLTFEAVLRLLGPFQSLEKECFCFIYDS